jgi:hypothetical protein
MWGLSHPCWAVIPVCLLLSSSAQLLAQSRSPRKIILPSRAKPFLLSEEPRPSFGPSDSNSPLVASFAHKTAPVGFKRSWAEPVTTLFVPSVGADRQLVNFGLLLPANADHPRLSKPAEGMPTREAVFSSSFVSDPAPPDRQIPDRFNDPQFYTRRIPGVGPIVDRVFEESKAHPRLTRVIKMIQPKF